MAGWRQTWRLLQLLVIFSLLILTNQSEMRGEAEEKLNLRGTSEEDLIISTPSLQNEEPLHRDEVLDAVLVGSDQQTMADRLQSAAEEVLVPTRSSDPSDGNTRQENGSEPQQRLPVSMKLLYNQTVCGSEPDQQNPKMEADPVPRTPRTSRTSRTPRTSRTSRTSRPSRTSRTSRTAPSPDEPLVQFDQQHIVMLADDEVVRTAAASLYHKHPAVSSLHAVRPQHRVRRVKGRAAPLSERGRLVLVGHGAREPSGEMRISGYGYQDVARIIQSSSRIGQKIQTTALVACGAGSDRRFPQALLQTLRRAGLETELHLWETDVQVAETGDVLSQDGARWRSGDHSKKLVLTVGRTGDIRRRDDRRRCTGQEVATNQTALLGKKGNKKENDKEKQPKEEPKTFIDPNVYQKVASDLGEPTKKIKETFRVLESLTWGFFHPEPPEQIKPQELCEKDSDPSVIIIGQRQTENTNNQKVTIGINFEENPANKKTILKNCFAIKKGRDIRNIIRYFGNNEKNEIRHLMVNNWIYEVDPEGLYVYPVGKKLNNNERDSNSVTKVKESIKVQMRKEKYPDIKAGIRRNPKDQPSPEVKCVQYFKNIFLEKPANIQPVEKEAWCTTYFTASVISESARNFRTFPLILMALDLTEKEKNMKDGLNFLFDEHSMARGGSWIDPSRRGFRGSATPEDSSKLSEEEPKAEEKNQGPKTKEKDKKSKTKKKNQGPKTKEDLLDDLKMVLSKEYTILTDWQKSVKRQHDFDFVTIMAAIAEQYKIFQEKEKEKKDFINKCIEFYNKINKEKPNDK